MLNVIDLDVHDQLAVSHLFEMINPAVLSELLAQMTAAIQRPPQAFELQQERDLIAALGQALGLRRVTPQQASAILEIFADLQYGAAMAAWRTWEPSPPLPRSLTVTGGQEPLWKTQEHYDAYLAAHAAQPRPQPPTRDTAWLNSAWDKMCAHAAPAEDAYNTQLRDVRTAIEFAVGRGDNRDAVLAMARRRAPLLRKAALETITDESAACWLRMRHDAALRAELAET